MPINQEKFVHDIVMAANIFIRKDGKWLVLRRDPNKKYLPNIIHPFGGKLDQDEGPFEGAEREVLEETGLTVRNMKLEAVIFEILPVKGENENWLVYHFSADYESGELVPTEEGKAEFLTTEEIKTENLFPSVRVVIDEILDPAQGTVFVTISYDEDGRVESNNLKIRRTYN